MSDYSELDGFLSRFLDGSIALPELERLERALVEDAGFADHFARWCLAHRQVAELLTESKLHDLMDQMVAGSPTLPKKARETGKRAAASDQDGGATVASAESRAAHQRKIRFTAAQLLAAAGIAAMITIVATLLVTDRYDSPRAIAASPGASAAAAEVGEPEPDMVATLTQIVSPVWATGATPLEHGQLLPAGSRVALSSGAVKLTYDCGAEIALQAPCDFIVEGRMVGVLKSGKLTANVPRRAFSFAILAPQVDFVDLGTAFGIDVGDDGRTQLHVFEGEVLCSRSQEQEAQRNELIHVRANKAVEFSSLQGSPSDISMSEAQFSKLFAMRRAADVKSGHVTEKDLALWLAADTAVTTDPEQRVISWQDIVYGDNKSGEDAIQVDVAARPLLVKDGLNGRPAVRFDGNSDYLLTTPLETTDDQTVLFVCQFSPNAYDKDRRWGGQIINYDGPPSRYLSDTLEPGVLQIGEPLLENEFKPTLLTGQVFAGFIGSAVVESGRVDTKEVGAHKPIVVAYVYDYDYENGESRLMINGRVHEGSRAFAPQGTTSRKIIGRHAWMQNHFCGDLAELMIFNKALNDSELAETTNYLAKKYDIAAEMPARPSDVQ
jgi:hypothetical protein